MLVGVLLQASDNNLEAPLKGGFKHTTVYQLDIQRSSPYAQGFPWLAEVGWL
jgi:hypothetical protein